jgi:hypothetical protein
MTTGKLSRDQELQSWKIVPLDVPVKVEISPRSISSDVKNKTRPPFELSEQL